MSSTLLPYLSPPPLVTQWSGPYMWPLPLFLNKITQPLFSGPVSKNCDGNYVDSKFSKGKHNKRKKTQFRQDKAKKNRSKGTSCRLPHICKYMRHVYMSSLDILNQRPVNRDSWCTKTRYFWLFWVLLAFSTTLSCLFHTAAPNSGKRWHFLSNSGVGKR